MRSTIKTESAGACRSRRDSLPSAPGLFTCGIHRMLPEQATIPCRTGLLVLLALAFPGPLFAQTTDAFLVNVAQTTSQAKPETGNGPGDSMQLDEEIISNDGAPMVLIPDGEFIMGSGQREVNRAIEGCKKKLGDENACRSFSQSELPQHRVFLDAFYMDQHEVTTSRYAVFLLATGRRAPKGWEQVTLTSHGEYPVVGIDWHDADAYCRWAGKRLPTEAEWEKAARGTDGRTYPWGNDPPSTKLANFADAHLNLESDLYGDILKPVRSYKSGKSPYGIYDMAGNVMEWMADWYEKSYYATSPLRNPRGPSDGKEKVVRGGAWFYGKFALRSAFRYGFPLPSRLTFIGVRCAKDAQ